MSVSTINNIVKEEISNDEILNQIPEAGLKNLLKSAGVKLAGNESEDELKGMYKMIPKTENIIRRTNRLARIYKEGRLTPEAIGGYQLNVYLRTDGPRDIDELAKCVESAINEHTNKENCQLNGTKVEEVIVNELHKSIFEKYVYHHDNLDSELVPDIVTESTDGDIYTNKQLIKKYAEELSEEDKKEYGVNFILSHIDKFKEDDNEIEELATAIQDVLIDKNIDIQPAQDGSSNWIINEFRKPDEDDPEVLVEKPIKLKRSKFIKH